MLKSLLSIVLISLTSLVVSAQIVLTEIMYNPPESGTDSLEYLELYNNSDQVVSLLDYTFTAGIEYTFDNFQMAPDSYVVVCKSSRAMLNSINVSVGSLKEWTDGALQNGGELIELTDAEGDVVFSVDYDDSGDWPGQADGTDGDGASIELCDPNKDATNPFNWSASSTNNFSQVNGFTVFATPGQPNDVECRDSSGPSYSFQQIVDVKMNDATGVSTFINEFVELQGIVHGTNTNNGGLQFTINDGNNNGIWVFSGSENFNYTPTEGDDLIVLGRITQFNGLTRIVPDSVEVFNSGNNLVDADVITLMEEQHEGALIKLDNVSMVDPGEWLGDGSSFNVNLTDGTNSYLMRIMEDTDLSNVGAPINLKSVTGLGGQFDSSAPHDEGYQILPRYQADLESDGFMTGGPNYIAVNISDIDGEDADGIAIADGDLVEVTAIAYGINYRPGGLQFTIIDDSANGIGVFSGSETWGYNFTEGDEVTVWGKVGQFFGLTQITLDSIQMRSQGNTLLDPQEIMTLGEDTESRYVQFVGLSYVNDDDWVSDGSSFNMDLTDGTNVITLRIDEDSPFAGLSFPPDAASFITGIGGQFDSDAPLDSGYQLFPLIFEPYLANENILLDNSLNIAPNPAIDFIRIQSKLDYDRFEIYSITGQKVLSSVSANINISNLENGSYFLIAKQENNIARKKFVVGK